MSEYIGGDNQTMGQISERVMRVLRPISPVNVGLPYQCRCGYTDWVRYRGRFYCWHCGRRYNDNALDVALFKGHLTFRQAFNYASIVASTGNTFK